MHALAHAAQYLRYAREAADRLRAGAEEPREELLRVTRVWLRLADAALDQARLEAAPVRRRRRRRAKRAPAACPA